MNDRSNRTKDGLAIKTLFLKSLPRDLKGDHLFDYFSTFGPLQSVRIHLHATNSFGIVKFEEAEAAENALNMERHMIDGRTIEIANDCHQEPTTNDELPIELTNLTGTQFMNLNDDCLRQILIRVPLMDLDSVLKMAERSRNIRLREIVYDISTRGRRDEEVNYLHRSLRTSVDQIYRLLNMLKLKCPEN